MKTIKFYKTRETYGAFSNFSRHAICVDNTIWPTSEHYFQAMKFEDPKAQELIRRTGSPAIAAKFGRDRSFYPIRVGWDEEHRNIFMGVALRAKFTQHPDLQELLLSTGDATLVEHTDKDSYWGDGGDGSGENMLGKLLMRLRDQLKREETPMKCTFNRAWIGQCKAPAVDGDRCEKHCDLKCCVCGAKATRSCDVTLGPAVCGFKLCDACEHIDGTWRGLERLSDSLKHRRKSTQ